MSHQLIQIAANTQVNIYQTTRYYFQNSKIIHILPP